MIKSIVVAADTGRATNEAIEYAATLAELHRAHLRLVLTTPAATRRDSDRTAMLDDLTTLLRRREIDVDAEYAVGPSVDAICRAAASQLADTLILDDHQDAANGSIVELARRSKCNVMIVRSG